MSIAIDAVDYWNLVSVTQPNGWNQQLHPDYGQSHSCLRVYRHKHGEAEFDKALNILFKRDH